MGYRSFKKEAEAKKQQAQTFRELENATNTLRKQRDKYAQEAKIAYMAGDKVQYNAKVALLKNAMFNLSQTQEMLTNFQIAMDVYKMQTLNKKFVKSFSSVMKKVNSTCKSINVGATGKLFTKAMFNSGAVSQELKDMLSENNVTFSSVVDSLSDVTDDDIKALLGDEISSENMAMEDSLAGLENEIFGANASTPSKGKVLSPIGGGSGKPSAPSAPRKPEPKKAPKAPKVEPEIEPNFDDLELPEIEAPAAKPEPKHLEKPAKPAEQKVEEPKDEMAETLEKYKKENKPKTEEVEEEKTPEDEVLNGENKPMEYEFKWDEIPQLSFEDIAGLDDVKDFIITRVIIPLRNPELLEGYETRGGGGLCLYGPPGTGKSMFASAIAHEIDAKFCEIKPSEILRQGIGNSEKAVKKLFQEARSFPCAVIFFDEMDSIAPKRTMSTAARQLRSEFLAQLQGVDAYKKDKGNILFVVCATNKPWDIDSAFLRPGRFGTRVYVGLPDEDARRYMIERTFEKIRNNGVVELRDIDVDIIVEKTNGFNGSDISNLLNHIQDRSFIRAYKEKAKYITMEDVMDGLENVHSTVQADDIVKLKEWKCENDYGE